MLIANARVAQSAERSAYQNLEIRGGRVFSSSPARTHDAIDLTGYLLLPGLINAHDHLEFSLFPRLGRRIYANATEWAKDIYRPDKPPVREHRRVPKHDRLIWGGLRNLLSGVTTVANHNPFHPELFNRAFPVRVLRRFGWAHSLAFAPSLVARYHATPSDRPFLIHAGEGTDEIAHSEIPMLDRLGILSPRTVLAHGIALESRGLDAIRRHRAPVVWCPSSNLLTYGKTLSYARIRSATRLALGTDSPISAAGDMADELRVARAQGAPAEDLYKMVTTGPAAILQLEGGAGTLADGARADFIAVGDSGQRPADALMNLVPEIVFLGGRLNLVSTRLAAKLPKRLLRHFQRIELEGRGEWLVPFDISRLLRKARAAIGNEIRLAGKRVTQ
jgi:cytosine/adenosine deaminase-related metal-dependent hydrolase